MWKKLIVNHITIIKENSQCFDLWPALTRCFGFDRFSRTNAFRCLLLCFYVVLVDPCLFAMVRFMTVLFQIFWNNSSRHTHLLWKISQYAVYRWFWYTDVSAISLTLARQCWITICLILLTWLESVEVNGLASRSWQIFGYCTPLFEWFPLFIYLSFVQTIIWECLFQHFKRFDTRNFIYSTEFKTQSFSKFNLCKNQRNYINVNYSQTTRSRVIIFWPFVNNSCTNLMQKSF